MREPRMLLAGDVGGTTARLAIVSPAAASSPRRKNPRAPLAKATFASSDYPSLEALVREFLARADLVVRQAHHALPSTSSSREPVERSLSKGAVQAASLAVAGPVVAGRATITNLSWVVDEEQLAEALGLSTVRLLNDLEAIAYAVPHLDPADLHTLHVGEPDPAGAVAVIAPGTGLGEAYLTWDGSRYRPHASEGGHADFAPANDLEVGLLAYLRARFGHVSWERVCSGRGLPNIYEYLRESGRFEEPPWLAERLASAEDPTPIIVNAALDEERECDPCTATLNTFVSILGAEAGNLALKVLATGGVYLGGGIPRRILPALEGGRFLEAFRRKGRMSELLARIPVHVILNPEAALLGAACLGLEAEHD